MYELTLKEWIDAVNRFNKSIGLPMLQSPQSRDGYEPPVVHASEPTTVDGWIRTLPTNLMHGAIHAAMNIGILDKDCKSLVLAIDYIREGYAKGCDERAFWLGVGLYLTRCDYTLVAAYKAVDGFNAAKAAFEAKELPILEPIYTTTDTHRVVFSGNGGIYGSSAVIVEKGDGSPVVTEGMASMPWSEFETLTRKATAFDSLMTTFDALQGFRDSKNKEV